MSIGVGVAVFILNSENKILIGKRIPAGVWALAGGKMDFGETPEETAIRETKEEVGLDIVVERRLGCMSCVKAEINYHFVIFFIQARLKDAGQEVQNLEPEKHQDWQWRDYNDFPSPLFFPLSQYRSEINIDPSRS